MKDYNFIAVKKIINDSFTIDNSYSIELISICETIYDFINILNKPFSKNYDILFAIKNLKSKNSNYNEIYENFPDLKICLEKILEVILIDDKKQLTCNLEHIITYYLSPEIIFEFLNKKILETNFRVGFNELDVIFKHTCVILKEGLKNKNQNINFVLREENFINKLNQKIIENPMDMLSDDDFPNRIIYPPIT